MTYGWSILIVLVAIGCLVYFGVLSPERFKPTPYDQQLENTLQEAGDSYCKTQYPDYKLINLDIYCGYNDGYRDVVDEKYMFNNSWNLNQIS